MVRERVVEVGNLFLHFKAPSLLNTETKNNITHTRDIKIIDSLKRWSATPANSICNSQGIISWMNQMIKKEGLIKAHFYLIWSVTHYLYSYLSLILSTFYVIINGLTIPLIVISIFALKFLLVPIILIILFIPVRTKPYLIMSIPEVIFTQILSHFKEVHPQLTLYVKGPKGGLFSNYPLYKNLCTLFLTLVFVNLGGMIHGIYCSNTFALITIGLSLTLWIGTLILPLYNIFTQSFNYSFTLAWLGNFFPAGTPLWLAPVIVPIEIISYCIRPLSMGLRIAGNLVAGHVIMALLELLLTEVAKITITFSSWIAVTIISIFYILLFGMELCVAVIQGYVLTLLASTFLREAESLH